MSDRYKFQLPSESEGMTVGEVVEVDEGGSLAKVKLKEMTGDWVIILEKGQEPLTMVPRRFPIGISFPDGKTRTAMATQEEIDGFTQGRLLPIVVVYQGEESVVFVDATRVGSPQDGGAS